MSSDEPRGWYRRGDQHPQHFDPGRKTQFVTFRLTDSLPLERLRVLKRELELKRIDEEAYHERVEAWLDAGQGHCWLHNQRVAEIVFNAVLHFDGSRYDLFAATVMPNHVHVLFRPSGAESLATILRSWKSFTSKQANRVLGRTGAFWQDDYFDRCIRDENHYRDVIRYIAENAVRARLCQRAEDWPWFYLCSKP